MLKYLVFLSSVPENASNHKGEMSVWLLLIISPFHHNWVHVNEGNFGKAPKDAGWLGLELLVPPQFTGRREGLEVESVTNGWEFAGGPVVRTPRFHC